MNILLKYFFGFCLLSVIIGCQMTENSPQNDGANLENISFKNTSDQQESKQAVNDVLQMDEINKAKAVNSKETLVLAFDVHHFKRFRMKKIEKQVKNKLNKQFPDKTVKVSYDKKIMLEVEQLQRKMDKTTMKKDKLNNEIKKITKLMAEKT